MITRKRFVGALALAGALTLGSHAPAPALDVSVGGIDGSISVQSGFGACASLSFSGGVAAGEFTAFAAPLPVGLVAAGSVGSAGVDTAGIDTADPPVVVDVVPFVATGSTWTHCLSGAVPYGTGTYSLVATGPGGDFAEVLQCRRLSATMSCT